MSFRGRGVWWAPLAAAVWLWASGCCGECEQAGTKLKPSSAEKITYGPVQDDPKGPSRVKPSGLSGKTLKTPQGVIETWAEEVDLRDAERFPADPSYCQGTENVTDLFKNVALEFDREARKQTPISEAEEVKLGDKLAAQIASAPDFKGKVDTARTAEWRAYLARVAQPLLAEIKRKKITYRFHVIESPVANAFAIPGGHIYFFTGLLENLGHTWLANEAQLAGILAHEIGHVDLGHCAAVYQYLKQLGLSGSGGGEKVGTIAIALARHPFSSAQEDEADANAVRIMALAQYSPQEFVNLWKSWAKAEGEPGKKPRSPKAPKEDVLVKELENLLRSHSTARKRACNAMEKANEEVPKNRFDRFYVGETNFRRKTPRTERQY